MENNYEIRDAQLEARAGELLTYMNKWNMTAEEAVDTLYRTESLIRQKREKIFLADLLKQVK